MRAESELASLIRALSTAPADLDEMERLLPAGGTLADPAMIERLPNNYRSACKEHCALWERCRAHALAAGQPIILGDLAAEQLAAAGSSRERWISWTVVAGRPKMRPRLAHERRCATPAKCSIGSPMADLAPRRRAPARPRTARPYRSSPSARC